MFFSSPCWILTHSLFYQNTVIFLICRSNQTALHRLWNKESELRPFMLFGMDLPFQLLFPSSPFLYTLQLQFCSFEFLLLFFHWSGMLFPDSLFVEIFGPSRPSLHHFLSPKSRRPLGLTSVRQPESSCLNAAI